MALLDLTKLPDERVEQILRDLMGRDAVQTFRSLEGKTRETFKALATKQLLGNHDALKALYKTHFEFVPVPPQIFFTHTDYLGHMWSDVFPRWKRELPIICDPQNRISELILPGSLGSGKSTIAALVLVYKLYELSALADPSKFFGLTKDAQITFGVFSRTVESSEEDNYDKLVREVLEPSPYFNDRFPIRVLKNRVKMPKHLTIITGSTFGHQIGKTIYGLLIDEINFLGSGAKTGSKLAAKRAHELANAVSRRLSSRFLDVTGAVPGICIFISSKLTKTSFLANREREKRHQAGVKIIDGPRWEFRDTIAGGQPYSGGAFRVLVADQTRDSQILDLVTRDQKTGEWAVTPLDVEDHPEGSYVISVPVEHYKDFIEDLDGALRDIASVATDSIQPLFTRPAVLRDAVNPHLPQPIQKEIVPFYVKDPLQFWDLFDVPRAMLVSASRWVPKRHSRSPRYLHVDLAATDDRAGMVMVHPSSHVYAHDNDGKPVLRKSVEVDFAVAFSSGPFKEDIDFTKIEEAIVWLRDQGWPIRMVTFDSWQSRASIQRLQEAFGKSVVVKVQSVDTKPDPYKTLRGAFAEGRMRYTEHKLLMEELKWLEVDPLTGKIDHPDDQSKDVADALCGATYGCLTDTMSVADYGDSDPEDAASHPGVRRHRPFLAQMRALNRQEERDGSLN